MSTNPVPPENRPENPGNPENDGTPDPLENLENLDRRASVRLAWQMALGFPVATILLWVLLDQTAGESTPTRVLPILLALAGPLATGWVVLHKWRRYQWWQPFMGTLWWLIPFFLIVATTLLPPLITGR